MKTRTILFDLDDTLMPEMASEEAAMAAACAFAQDRCGVAPDALMKALERRAEEEWAAFEPCRYGDHIGMAWWEAMWATFDGPDEELAKLKEWAPGYRHRAWTRALADLGVNDEALADDLLRKYQQERRNRFEPLDDAAEVLEDLKADFQLGLLTNGAPDVQRAKLEGSGLAGYFDDVLVCGDIRVGKPDPKPFAVVLERMGAARETSVMVGNSLTSAVMGAANAGVRSIWLNLDGSWERPDLDVAPDVEIKSLGEIRRVLE